MAIDRTEENRNDDDEVDALFGDEASRKGFPYFFDPIGNFSETCSIMHMDRAEP